MAGTEAAVEKPTKTPCELPTLVGGEKAKTYFINTVMFVIWKKFSPQQTTACATEEETRQQRATHSNPSTFM